MAGPGTSAIWSGLYGDQEVATLFTDSAALRAMLVVEGALAQAQAKVGLIPAEAATVIQRASLDVVIDPAVLASGTASAGVPVPGLVEAFRAALPEANASAYVGASTGLGTPVAILSIPLFIALAEMLI